MSENLKRAESLFNRIMNPNVGGNGPLSSDSTSGSGYNGSSGGRKNDSRRENNNNGHHYRNHHHNNHHKYNKHSSNNSSSNGGSSNLYYRSNAHVDLPKKDPVKTAQECLETIPSDHHILPYCWTIWHHLRSRWPKSKGDETSKDQLPGDKLDGLDESILQLSNSTEPESEATSAAASATAVAAATAATPEDAQYGVNTYLQTTREVDFSRVDDNSKSTSTIGSLEQMWWSILLLKKTYEMTVGREILVFKSGVNPVWEDPINAKGGRWVFRFLRKPPYNHDPDYTARMRKKMALIWERLLLRTLTGLIIPEGAYLDEIRELLLSDITGLVLSIRRDEDIISVWNLNLNFIKKKNEEEKPSTSKKLTLFQARRIICDLILRTLRECDQILQGADCVEALDNGLNERLYGVSFEYRLHGDNNQSSEKRRYPKLYIKESSDQ